jgi:hypothetical protein
MLRDGRQSGTGYPPSSASTHLAVLVVGLRRRGVTVSGDEEPPSSKQVAGALCVSDA